MNMPQIEKLPNQAPRCARGYHVFIASDMVLFRHFRHW